MYTYTLIIQNPCMFSNVHCVLLAPVISKRSKEVASLMQLKRRLFKVYTRVMLQALCSRSETTRNKCVCVCVYIVYIHACAGYKYTYIHEQHIHIYIHQCISYIYIYIENITYVCMWIWVVRVCVVMCMFGDTKKDQYVFSVYAAARASLFAL